MTDLADTAESLRPLFWPGSVAVLGASGNPNKIGGIPVRSLKQNGYRGDLYPINPTRETVQELTAYPSLAAVDGPVDVAIMAVPASIALAAAEDCAAKGVKALVVLTAGFAEVDEQGHEAQSQLAEIGRSSGMRIVGPNCLGYFNPKNGCYGTFSTAIAHGLPKVGHVGMVSQSGAFGAHCFVLGREKGLGFSYWITTGNECDVDVADCIAFMAQDPQTKVIAVYLEGCRNGDKLEQALSLAHEAGKPVVIQKVGASEVGSMAAAAHTASVTGSDHVYEAVFDRYNVHRCRTVDELIDVAYACSAGVYPTRGKVCIVTISGGAGVMMADAASELGLDVAPLSEKSQQQLKALTPFAAVRNPVDFTAQVYNDMSLITKNYETILGDEDYDAIVGFFMFLPYSDYLSDEILKALKPVRERFPDRLIIQSIFGPKKNIERFEADGYLVIAEPCRALEVVAALYKIGQGFARGLTQLNDLPAAPRLEPGVSKDIDARQLLTEAGIPIVEVQPAGPNNAVEIHLSVQGDAVFGPVVQIGLGDALGDVIFGRAPLGESDARKMIEGANWYPLLTGEIASAAADVESLTATISRLSVFAETNRNVVESVKVGPLFVLPEGQGVVALDASIVTKDGTGTEA